MNSAQVPLIGIMVVALIAICFVVGVAILIAVAVKTRSTAAVIGVIAALLTPVLLIALIVPVATSKSQRQPPIVQQTIPMTEMRVPLAPSAPLIQSSYGWIADAPEAGIYSSPDRAAAALTRSLLQDFGNRHAEHPAAISIRISPLLNEWIPSLGPSFSKTMRDNFPTTEVAFETLDGQLVDAESSSKNQAMVMKIEDLDLTRSTSAPWDPTQSHVKGGLALTANYLDYQFEDSKSFVDKPWVAQFDKYISQRPERRLLRAVSTDFGLTPEETEQSARNIAASLLATQVNPGDRELNRSALSGMIMNTLDANQLIVDRFTQERSTISGNKVWQTALLIDAGPNMLNELENQFRQAKFEEDNQRQSTFGGIALLAILVVILYFVLNEFTKGYFVWNLRASAMLMMLCLAVAFCWWVKIS